MKNSVSTLFALLMLFGCQEPVSDKGIVYPENCFMHNEQGGHIIDVTRPPYNADPTGTEDCSDALGKGEMIIFPPDRSSFCPPGPTWSAGP